MKKILFRFPIRYYLNPISILCTGMMVYMEITRWQTLFAKIAEFETYNVKHFHNHFELIPGTVFALVWTVFNILLYPYVFDWIVTKSIDFLGSGILIKNLVKHTISIYQAEIERGDIYTHHEIEYGWHGYPIGLVPKFDKAKERAFDEASYYVISRIGFLLLPIFVLPALLVGGWLTAALIGWPISWFFDEKKK